MKKIRTIIEKGEAGYWIRLMDYEGVYSYSDDFAGIETKVKESLNLYLEEMNKPALESIKLEIYMDLLVFFEENDWINISKLAGISGINASLLRQYARGIKFPSLKQVKRIEESIHLLGDVLRNTQFISRTQ